MCKHFEIAVKRHPILEIIYCQMCFEEENQFCANNIVISSPVYSLSQLSNNIFAELDHLI